MFNYLFALLPEGIQLWIMYGAIIAIASYMFGFFKELGATHESKINSWLWRRTQARLAKKRLNGK